MNKKALIDLTPLLDIVLIILFAFMLNANAHFANADNKNEELSKQEQKLLNENQQLADKVKNLEQEISQTNFYRNKEKEFYKDLTAAYFNSLDKNKDEIDKLLNQLDTIKKDEVIEQFEKLLNEKVLVKEMIKYQEISKRVFFLEVGIATAQNQIYLNSKPTNFFVILPEDKGKKEDMKQKIIDLIDNEISSQQGGVGMVLIGLTWLDDEVDKDAYDLVWSAIKGLENTYGNTRFFKTEYGFLEMGGN
jgi:biopolymer transport protein ExbD